MSSLYVIGEKFKDLKELFENDIIDEQTYEDTLSCLECEIEEKAENYCKIIAGWQGDIEAVKVELDRLNNLKKRYEGNIQKLKDNLLMTMENQGRQDLKAGLYSVKIKVNPPSVNIIDEKLIPKTYFIQKPAELSKKLISEAIKNGDSVAGAELVQKTSLQIK